MWFHHRWTGAGYVVVVVAVLGLAWAALVFSNATDSAAPQATCGCGQADSEVIAQAEGDTFQIAVPAETPISETAIKLIYVGSPGPRVEATGCVSDTELHPTQTVKVIDPAGGGSTRVEGVVTLTKNGSPFLTAMPNGTKLGNFRDQLACDVGGIPYFSYTATALKGEPQYERTSPRANGPASWTAAQGGHQR